MSNLIKIRELIIGFTGTRKIWDVDDYRQLELKNLIEKLNPSIVIHGCAYGADTLFHSICKNLSLKIIGYPGFYNGLPKEDFYFLNENKKPLLRNKDIVRQCDLLIALPINPLIEEQRSGTWATIRFARKLNKQIIII